MKLKMEEEDKTISAYLAGLMDMNGSFIIRKTEKNAIFYYSSHCSFTHINEKLIEYFRLYYATSYHIVNPSQPNWKPIHTIFIRTSDKIKFLENILPYLIIKRKQANYCLALQKNIEINRGLNVREIMPYREKLYQEFKKV